MKINLPIRDVTNDVLRQVDGDKTIFNPFVMMDVPPLKTDGEISRRMVPVWLEVFESSAGYEAFKMDRIIKSAAWGLPISRHQKLDDYLSLEPVNCGIGIQTRKASMVGLYERIKLSKEAFGNPDLDIGEAYLLKASIGNLELFGVNADSYGAARRFVEQAHQASEFQAANLDMKMPPLDLP